MPTPVAVRLLGWAQAAHPYPVLVVLCLTALIAVLSAPPLSPQRLGLVLAAVLLSQLSIGWSNDYLDREADAFHQPWKPVAAGRVPARGLALTALLAMLGAFTVAASLGLAPLLLLLAGTGAGLAYNLGVKRSRLSWLPYVAGFAALPAFVWTALGSFRAEQLWLYALGTPLVLAAHLANALPDAGADARLGVRSLSVHLGRTGSLRALAACLALSPLLVLATLPWLHYQAAILAVSLAGYGLQLAAAFRLYLQRYSRPRDVAAFRLVAASAVFLACGWLGALA